ncbi:MAG TPA: MDR family oxidoreductase [Chloroflexota bacterium]|nr:MDR family oxidoreductase [Chloroflexota bacterium]
MQEPTYSALVVDKTPEGVTASVRQLSAAEIPPNEVTVAVAYSDLNYKDAMAVSGRPGILRQYPMVPGIDFAGTVVASESPHWKPGEQVIATGWGIGERTWGGLGQLARVKADWLVPLPEGMTLEQAMGIGTAGFTAMLCLMALEDQGLTPESANGREVVVTGAGGGVGGVAVVLLGRLGYNVTAVTGRPALADYLKELGACQVISRSDLPVNSARPLESQRWAAGVDVVGGEILAAVLRQVAYYGSVAMCGLAGAGTFTTSVLPFILRGVKLIGVESIDAPAERRRAAWRRLARELPPESLNRLTRVVSLAEVPRLAEEVLRGESRGRIVVDVGA